LKNLGIIIYLKNSKKILLNRIFNDMNRPLRFETGLFEKRHSCYNSIANIVISCDYKSIEEVADEILLRIKIKEKE